MKVLALELSSARGSLAWRGEDNDFVRDWPNDRQNSGAFFQELSDARSRFGVPDLIIVGLGPGSYAGTRIAISAAIGLAASGVKSTGYPSICAIDSEANEYFVIGDARRQSFFFARVVLNNLVEGPDLFSESDLAQKLRKLNSAMPIFASEQPPQFENVILRYPSAAVLARLATDPSRQLMQPPLQPMYLREPHITTPRAI
jgi:tRNA threonylcarbamoyl adenosine modification protein YeaZ